MGKPIVESLFPGEANGRIPTISYSGGPEIDGFGPELTEILEDQGHRVGLACDQGLVMNGRVITITPSANSVMVGRWSVNITLRPYSTAIMGEKLL